MGSLDAFLAPISEPNPSGIDLRNDVRFHALERLLLPASRAARAEAPGTEPDVDWTEVLRQCEELGTTGRDLRLLVIVARALAHDEGFRGVAEGLSLLTQTIETYWPSLHPELRDRASPREAAVRRINALFQLESVDDGLLCDLSHRTMFTLRGLGRFTGADLAAGSLSRAAFLSEVPSGLGAAETAALVAQHEAQVERVRTACRALAAEEPGVMADLAGGAEQARAALTALEHSLSPRVSENGSGVTFTRLGRFLDQVATSLTEGQKAAAAPVDAAMRAADDEPGQTASAEPAAITSRRDVERMLDGIIAFYERTEPASPIPLIARRLRRMVPMTFLQLMEEMAPAGLKEVRSLAGVLDEKARAKGGTDG